MNKQPIDHNNNRRLDQPAPLVSDNSILSTIIEEMLNRNNESQTVGNLHKWEVIKEIGRGGFGVVFECVDRGNGIGQTKRAVKICQLPSLPSSFNQFDEKKSKQDRVKAEARILQHLSQNTNCKSIVKLWDVLVSDQHNAMLLVMELVREK